MKGISFGFRFPGSEKHLRDLGVGWVRESVLWQNVQPDQRTWTWLDFDNLMACLARIRAATGCKVLLTIRAKSGWASRTITGADNRATRPPLNMLQYAEFLQRVATRAGERVDFWQLENECDYTGFWAGTSLDYLSLFATARTVLPKLCLCGWSTRPTEEAAEVVAGHIARVTRTKMLAFIETVMTCATYDAADAHCYAPYPADVAGQLAWVRSRMKSGTVLFASELGWEDQAWTHTQAQQAEDLSARVTAAATIADVPMWFLLRDVGANGVPRNAAHNGLVAAGGQRKAAFESLRSLT